MTMVAEPPRKRDEEGTGSTPTSRPPGTAIRIGIGLVALVWAVISAVQITTEPTRGELKGALRTQSEYAALLGGQVNDLFNRSADSADTLEALLKQAQSLPTTDDKAKLAFTAQLEQLVGQARSQTDTLGIITQKFKGMTFESYNQSSFSLSLIGEAKAATKKPAAKSWIRLPGNLLWVSIVLSVMVWLYGAGMNAMSKDKKKQENGRQSMDRAMGFWVGLGTSGAVTHI